MTTNLTTPRILTAEGTDKAVKLLKRYYRKVDGKHAFDGASFESLGSEDTNPFSITPADLLALSTLSIPVKGHTAIDLLSNRVQAQTTALLRDIPEQASIDDEDALKHLAEGGASPASELWAVISDVDGMGPVYTSKLLARKRPALIPVYDKVVDAQLALGGTLEMWTRFHEWVNRPEDGDTLINRARNLHAKAGLAAHVTPLRVIDVVLWMDGKQS